MSTVTTNVINSVCVDNFNFTVFLTDPISPDSIFRQTISQNQAQQECNAFGETQFTLGPIETAEQYNTIKNLLLADEQTLFTFDRTLTEHQVGFYIGLHALVDPEPKGGDTTIFSFVESSADLNSLEFYHVTRSQYPWKFNEPDNVGGNQTCAQMLFQNIPNDSGSESNGELDDIECDRSNGFVCRSSCVAEIGSIDDDARNLNWDTNIYLICISSFAFGLVVSVVCLIRLNLMLKKTKKKFDSLRLSLNISS